MPVSPSRAGNVICQAISATPATIKCVSTVSVSGMRPIVVQPRLCVIFVNMMAISAVIAPIPGFHPLSVVTAQVIVDDDDDAGSGFETRSDDSIQWAEDSDLSDEYVDGVEELLLAAALPSHLQPSSEVPAEQLSPEASADPPAVSPPSATSAELPAASADPPATATDVSPSPEDSSAVLPSTSDAPAAETQVLFQSSASPPDAQPVPSTPDVPPSVPSSTQSDHVLDSEALVIVDNPPPPPARPLRPSRRHPAPVPEALAAAARRKPTKPSLVSGRPRPAAASPMDVSAELKRKAAQTAAREKDKKKKGRK